MNSSTHQLDQLDRLAIVGTGLLGASVGLAVKAAGFAGEVVGVGRRRATVEKARALGAVDTVADDLAGAARGSGLMVVAVPLGAFDRTLAELSPHIHEQMPVTDVGSTKGSVLAAAHRWLPRPGRFVGSHPMAGSERQGPESADAGLFAGKPCIVTPEDDTDDDALALVESLWQQLGMTLLRMSAEAHDRAVATVSHLPHAAAVMLVQVAMRQGGWDVASTGFRDTTRLASSNPPMRADIMANNREALLSALQAMRDQIDRLSDVLQHGDDDALLSLLESSQAAREDWLAQREAVQRPQMNTDEHG